MTCENGCCGVLKFDLTKLDSTIEKYSKTDGSLITVLQKAQEIYGYLPREVMEHIADSFGIKPAKVYGAATFYTQFRFEPVGKYLIMLCQGTACHVNGSKFIEEALCDELSISDGETTADGLFTLNNVACLGCCSLSPVMMINGETYGMLSGEKAREIVRSIRAADKEAV